MDAKNITLTPSVPHITNHEYFDHFDNTHEVHALLKARKYQEALPKIKALCEEAKDMDFELNKGGYTRNILSKKDGYWLSFLKWDKGVTTPAHGHPAQAFVYTVKGSIAVTNYRHDDEDFIESVSSDEQGEGEFFYSHGDTNKFDNAVHQISTQEECITLHFYSDDPRKGKMYKEKA